MKQTFIPLIATDFPKNHIGRLLLSLKPEESSQDFSLESYTPLVETIETIERHNPGWEFELQSYGCFYAVKRLT